MAVHEWSCSNLEFIHIRRLKIPQISTPIFIRPFGQNYLTARTITMSLPTYFGIFLFAVASIGATSKDTLDVAAYAHNSRHEQFPLSESYAVHVASGAHLLHSVLITLNAL